MGEKERAELRGTTLDGRYEVGPRLGTGATGLVFSGKRLSDGMPLAIKTLKPRMTGEADLARRLRREAEVARAVAHPGVVRVLDEGTLQDGSPYIVMPRLYGESLSTVLARSKRLQPNVAAWLGMRVASVLHAVHAAGFIHRDVKPEHVLIGGVPSGPLQVHLLDFGVCASAHTPPEERKRESGRVFGTPSYVSPEQAAGDPNVDGRADLFSLGVVLFEALTGKRPFQAPTTHKLLLRIIREEAPSVCEHGADVPAELDRLLRFLMARERGRRLPSARAAGRALAPVAGQPAEAQRLLIAAMRPGLGRRAAHRRRGDRHAA